MSSSAPMTRALALARQANHATSPNPMVGAVLVRDGEIVGEGFHQLAGEPHAEVLAVRAAGQRAVGSTLYVTLEPCAHEGRTGPCAAAVAEAGVRRVVVAGEDPDPRVAGRGLSLLRAAGLEVEVGDGQAEAERLNSRWLGARRAGRAYCALKFAMSLDGKIATSTSQSRWITSEPARAEAHRLRRAYEAVAVGARTVALDDPRLTAREPDGTSSAQQPLRVVIGGRAPIPAGAAVLDPGLPGRTIVAAGGGVAVARREELRSARVKVEALGEGPQVDFDALLRFLFTEGARSLLVEGGGEVAWAAVEAGVVDHVYAFIAPVLVGGKAATPVGGRGFADLAGALRLDFVATRQLGPDILVEAVPV